MRIYLFAKRATAICISSAGSRVAAANVAASRAALQHFSRYETSRRGKTIAFLYSFSGANQRKATYGRSGSLATEVADRSAQRYARGVQEEAAKRAD